MCKKKSEPRAMRFYYKSVELNNFLIKNSVWVLKGKILFGKQCCLSGTVLGFMLILWGFVLSFLTTRCHTGDEIHSAIFPLNLYCKKNLKDFVFFLDFASSSCN